MNSSSTPAAEQSDDPTQTEAAGSEDTSTHGLMSIMRRASSPLAVRRTSSMAASPIRVASVIRVPSMTEASASPAAVRLSQRRSLLLPPKPPADGT